jgi:TPR repeat protein
MMTVDAIRTMLVPEGKSLYDMGVMYASGRGCEYDLVAAHCWFNIAAARGDRDAAQRRAELAREMSANEVSIAQRAAREWLKLH